jgi:hypothetical protein
MVGTNPVSGGLGTAEPVRGRARLCGAKLNNRGQYIDLQRRPSFSRTAPDVRVTDEFQGFETA